MLLKIIHEVLDFILVLVFGQQIVKVKVHNVGFVLQLVKDILEFLLLLTQDTPLLIKLVNEPEVRTFKLVCKVITEGQEGNEEQEKRTKEKKKMILLPPVFKDERDFKVPHMNKREDMKDGFRNPGVLEQRTKYHQI